MNVLTNQILFGEKRTHGFRERIENYRWPSRFKRRRAKGRKRLSA